MIYDMYGLCNGTLTPPPPQLTSAGRKEVLHDLNQHSEMELLVRVGSLEDRSATIPCFHNMIKHHSVLLGTPVQAIMFFISRVFVEFPSSIRGHSSLSQIYTYFIILFIYYTIYIYILFFFQGAPPVCQASVFAWLPPNYHFTGDVCGRISVPFFGALLIPGLGFLVQILEFTAEN